MGPEARGRRRARGSFPGCRLAAGLAIAEDGLAGDKNVRFDFVLLDLDAFLAEATFEVHAGSAGPRLGRRRKFDLPEVEILVAKSHTVNIAASIFAETADQFDFGFAARFDDTHGEDFVGRKFVAGTNAGAVEAQNEGVCLLRKDAT